MSHLPCNSQSLRTLVQFPLISVCCTVSKHHCISATHSNSRNSTELTEVKTQFNPAPQHNLSEKTHVPRILFCQGRRTPTTDLQLPLNRQLLLLGDARLTLILQIKGSSWVTWDLVAHSPLSNVLPKCFIKATFYLRWEDSEEGQRRTFIWRSTNGSKKYWMYFNSPWPRFQKC